MYSVYFTPNKKSFSFNPLYGGDLTTPDPRSAMTGRKILPAAISISDSKKNEVPEN